MTTKTKTETAMTQAREQMVRGLRDLADFLERHPEVPEPGLWLNSFAHSKEQLAALARIGKWQKGVNESFFNLTRNFGESVALCVGIARSEVCERIVVGERVVPAVPEHTVEVVEWKCDGSLLDDGAA